MTGSSLLRVGIWLCLMLLGVSGCDGTLPFFKGGPPVAKIIDASHTAAEALIKGAGIAIDKKRPLIAATFVNIDDVEQTSSFGRITSKQVASGVTQQGYNVVEMLFRHNVFIKQNSGEFVLSRELRNITSEHNAQAVIVGTYAVGRKTVYVTAMLIRAVDSIVLASYDYMLPVDADVSFLLQER